MYIVVTTMEVHNYIRQEAIVDFTQKKKKEQIVDTLFFEYDNEGATRDDQSDYDAFDAILFDNEISDENITQSDQGQRMWEMRDVFADAIFVAHTLGGGFASFYLKKKIYLMHIYFLFLFLW